MAFVLVVLLVLALGPALAGGYLLAAHEGAVRSSELVLSDAPDGPGRDSLLADLRRQRAIADLGRRSAWLMAIAAGMGAVLVVLSWTLAARAIRRWRREVEAMTLQVAAGDARRALLLDAVEVGAFEADPHEGHVQLSRAAARLLRRPPGADPMSWEQAFAQVDAEDRDRLWRVVRESRGRVDGRVLAEIRVPRPEIGTLHLEVTGRLIRDGRGQPELVVGVLRDVTAQVTAEEARRAWTMRLEAEVAARTAEVERRAGEARALAAEIAVAETQERQRIAHVLHDGLQQTLMAARLRLVSATPQRLLEELEPLLMEAIQECRTLSSTLDPPVDPDAGLGPALGWLVCRMEERHGLQVVVSGNALSDKLSNQQGVMLFRAAHELLFNVVKHADTMKAWVSFDRVGLWYEMNIRDRGRGVAVGEASGGTGLAHLGRRLQALGGGLEIRDGEGGGCVVRVWVPYTPRTPATAPRVAPTTPSGFPS